MADNSWRGRIALIVLSLALCGAAACGRREDGTAPDEEGEAVVLEDMSQIKKVSFRETFGGYLEVQVIATEDKIQYQCTRQDPLGGEEPEVVTRSVGCAWDTWWDLVYIYGYNGVFNWKEQGTYLDLYYGLEEDPLMGYPELESVEAGDFFNIAGPDPGLTQAGPPPCYYGIDRNEEELRSRYSGHVAVYIDDEDTLYMERSYGPYGVPGEYAQFRKEFWDLIVGLLGLPDWRSGLGDWGRETLHKKYPYMLGDGESREIRYLSLLESYGGKESALAVSLVYDGGGQSIRYGICPPPKTYSVGRSGQPVPYCGEQSLPWESIEAVESVPGIPEGLPGIIERYGVDDWENGTGGTGYVRQGAFYNVENAEQVEDINERSLRSRYDALIHIVYTDGDHVEIWLENGQLPETYNDFRDELWDYMIPYMNEDRTGAGTVPDWREHIDQWGEQYMHIKYPYMAMTLMMADLGRSSRSNKEILKDHKRF